MATIMAEPFGFTHAGEPVMRYTLENRSGMRVSVLDYGCTVQSIVVPDRSGAERDVVLGYDTLADYESGTCWYGALVGRVANRIKGARFTLDGKDYTLSKNDGENHLHGVFERRVFTAQASDGALLLHRVSPDGEEGYPGTLTLDVTVRLTEDNALELTYDAVTDAPTVVNLTNHSYFNLNGQDRSDVLAHELTIHADRFTEIDERTVPTGRIQSVGGTPLDFRTMHRIGERIDATHRQIAPARGYDHSYILGLDNSTLRLAAEVKSPRSGICMTCRTTQPAVQFYSGNYIPDDASRTGKGGARYPLRGGFCLETQHYPASPNFEQFPSVVLRSGQRYHQQTIYQFSAE